MPYYTISNYTILYMEVRDQQKPTPPNGGTPEPYWPTSHGSFRKLLPPRTDRNIRILKILDCTACHSEVSSKILFVEIQRVESMDMDACDSNASWWLYPLSVHRFSQAPIHHQLKGRSPQEQGMDRGNAVVSTDMRDVVENALFAPFSFAVDARLSSNAR